MKKHNIVAQFSCSVDEYGNLKEYRVVSGSVFNEEYNETLDSGTLVLSQIKAEDRLSNIKPYDYVRVYDKLNPSTFDKLYLVDNFDETENNITEHIFGYTINLMSETKWLEKVQCPNLAITHELDDGSVEKKTIYQYIKQYMELYIPKIKFSYGDGKWSYEPLILMPGQNKISELNIAVEGQDFSEIGSEWVGIAYSSELNSDIDIDTIKYLKIINATGDYEFGWMSVSIDTQTRRIKFEGAVQSQPAIDTSGTITVSFRYESISEREDFYNRFNVPCADLAFTAPTLRQLFTSLMQQVGCIPTVYHRTLGFLDFQLDAIEMQKDNTINKITRSLSSDSFANTLLNMSSNVLDSGNKVICEALGFRDKSRALLKQQENLYLETKFPIYKVEKFNINAYVVVDLDINNVGYTGDAGWSDVSWQWLMTSSIGVFAGQNRITLKLLVNYTEHGSGPWPTTSLTLDGTLVAFKYGKTSVSMNINQRATASQDMEFYFSVGDRDMYYFVGTITLWHPDFEGYSYNVFYCNYTGNNRKYLCLYNQNITQLLVEASKRQYLSTNFSTMIAETGSANADLDTLAKYVYGTVGYNIGSNKIEGFSDTYNVGEKTVLGWIEVDYTYIENIWNFIVSKYQESIIRQLSESLGNMPTNINNYSVGLLTNNVEINSITPFNPQKRGLVELEQELSQAGESDAPTTALAMLLNPVYNWISSDINFAYLWFDIQYQPLNSFNLSYVKTVESVDIPISQYDGNVSGLTDFDRLSTHEQEQVDRIGNETLVINQRTDDYDLIRTFDNGPLFYKDDTNRDGSIDSGDNGVDYIIFKRSFTINNYHYNASYVGSKDAILKNYFTSIRTKYRAYQYVDYSQSTLRKEHDTFFVRFGEETWYDGDDKIFFGEYTPENLDKQQRLIGNILSIYKTAQYCILSDGEVNTKNDISVTAYKNFISIITEETDNVGSGTYIANDAFSQGISCHSALLGGVPQAWQIWNDTYNEKHNVAFVSSLNVNNIFDDYIDVSGADIDEIRADFDNILSMPIVTDIFVDLYSNDIGNVIFSVVDDNKNGEYKRTFYKDGAERINHTVQFIYYSDTRNMIWNENFLTTNLLMPTPNPSNKYLIDLTGQTFEINDNTYTYTGSVIAVNFDSVVSFHNGVSDNSNPYIQVDWTQIPGVTQFKVAHRTVAQTNRFDDYLAFRKGTEDIQKFYITLNDTKTDYVLAEQNGVLYRRYKVKPNSLQRKTEDI